MTTTHWAPAHPTGALNEGPPHRLNPYVFATKAEALAWADASSKTMLRPGAAIPVNEPVRLPEAEDWLAVMKSVRPDEE